MRPAGRAGGGFRHETRRPPRNRAFAAVALLACALSGLAGVASAGAASGAWEPTVSPLGAARSLHTATVLDDGTVLVAGGIGDVPALASVELYDPATGEWTAGPDLGQARFSHTATLLAGGRVLVTGGIDERGEFLASAELYDPQSGTWELADPLGTPRGRHSATRLDDGRVLVAGGGNAETTGRRGGGVSLASTELYDPGTGAWVEGAASLAVGRDSHTATLLASGEVLAVGGYKGYSFDLAGDTLAGPELFDPTAGGGAGAWLVVADPETHFHRTGHTAVLLEDGRVLVAGGQTGNTITGRPPATSAELFDPTVAATATEGRGAWSHTAPLIGGRIQHSATVLPGNRVLVAGGFGPTGEALISAEVYDVPSVTWSAAEPMTEGPRSLHAAVGLADGRVLVSGGATNFFGENPLDSGQVFTPAPSVSAVGPASGPAAGGTSVTITGTGFDQATGVSFAAVAASSHTVDSPTQITAVSPSGSAGAVDVTVTSPTGTSTVRSSAAFTYTATPGPGAGPPTDGAGTGDGGSAGGQDPAAAGDPGGGAAPGDGGAIDDPGGRSDGGAGPGGPESAGTPLADTGSPRVAGNQPLARRGDLADTGFGLDALVVRAVLCLILGWLLTTRRRGARPSRAVPRRRDH